MYQLEKIKQNIAEAINAALKKQVVKPADLIYPPKPEFGDLSLACFELAKIFNKTAVGMAEYLVGKGEYNGTVATAKAIGPFINFTLNKTKLAEAVIKEIIKEQKKYGANKTGKNKRVMIEFSSVNTHKEYHVGHLRNVSYGDAVSKILAANGFITIPVSYINDFGIHVAKCLWGWSKILQEDQRVLALRSKDIKEKTQYLVHAYVKTTQSLGALSGEEYGESKNNEIREKNTKKFLEIKEEISAIMKKIESRKGKEYKLWQATRKWSLDGFAKIYKELGVEFAQTFYENELIEKGLAEVEKLYAKHFLIRSQGAIIADLEEYNLGVLIFIRSDGTGLYPVADIPLAMEKFKKYKLDKSIYVVDVRQSLYFKQLFKVMDLLGYKKEMVHLSYEFVKLPEGMMQSRTGNVITYEELRGQVFKLAVDETKTRHDDWSEKKVNEVARKLTNGAMKFEMLKVNADKVITFDIKQALRFDGFTAGYLQYTYARIQSILRKSQIPIFKSQTTPKLKIQNLKLADPKELTLIMKLLKYPEAVENAGLHYNPAEIAKYIFELAQEFNDYYHSVSVLKAEEDVRPARLALIGAVSQVIKNGLELLGVEVMEEM